MKKNKTRLTVVVLDYLKARRVIKNVKFVVEQQADFRFKIIVIDNSCDSKNARILEKKLRKNKNVQLIINSQNLGYIRAHNAIKGEIKGDYLLILNPDILLKEKNVLQKMISYMDEHQEVGLIGPKQINDDGQIAMIARGWPKLFLQIARRTFLRELPFFKKSVEFNEMRHLDYNKTQDVDWLQSSCILIRKKLWDNIGGLDEDYFLFMSDPELCYQVWKKGFKVVYYSGTKVFADGKRISAGGFFSFFKSWILRQHTKDAFKYGLRHFFRSNPRKKYYEKYSN